jgi:hypothetical protein
MNKVQIWTCDGNTRAQNWTLNTNGTITIDGGCLDITGPSTSFTIAPDKGRCAPAIRGRARRRTGTGATAASRHLARARLALGRLWLTAQKNGAKRP